MRSEDPRHDGLRAAVLVALARRWEDHAREYRAQTETLLPNRAGNVERESLLWRARAYETCAEVLREAALKRRAFEVNRGASPQPPREDTP